LAVLVLLGLIPVYPRPASAVPPVIHGAGSSAAVDGRYIVVLKEGAALRAAGVPARAHVLTDRYRGVLGYTYERALHGFSVAMTAAQATKLAAEPEVSYVEQVQNVQAADTQENLPSWGLDRIDQVALPLDQTFTYDLPAQKVTAYVVDSGIRITHNEFAGRAVWGWDFATWPTPSVAVPSAWRRAWTWSRSRCSTVPTTAPPTA
jgi:hypothetical protein